MGGVIVFVLSMVVPVVVVIVFVLSVVMLVVVMIVLMLGVVVPMIVMVMSVIVVIVTMFMITIVFTLAEGAAIEAFDKADNLHLAFALVELGDECLFERKISSKVDGSNRKLREFPGSRGENVRIVIF